MRNILMLVFLLTACGQGDSSDPSGAADTRVAPAVAPAPAPAPAASATVAGIPAQFHGIWDNEEANCNPASDLRMEIGADSIRFYESFGSVTRVGAAPDGGLAVDLAMEGEGETWTSSFGLAVSGEGADERLLVQYQGEGEPPQTPLKLKRCPA